MFDPKYIFRIDERSFEMSNRIRYRRDGGCREQGKHKICCPVCDRRLKQEYGWRGGSDVREILRPEPGQLTQCDRCLAILEYTDLRDLRPASRDRVKAFEQLGKEKPRRAGLSEVIRYVVRYRQMPPSL